MTMRIPSIVILVVLMVSCVNDNLQELSTSKLPLDTAKIQNSNPPAGSSTSTATPVSAPTLAVSFIHDIKPIMVKYQCASCHGGSFQSYAGVQSLAMSGSLLGTMSWSPGYRRMPPSQKPSSSELDLISKWINEGLPNN